MAFKARFAIRCEEGLCSMNATFEVFAHRGESLGKFCCVHSNQRLKEQQAIEIKERDDAEKAAAEARRREMYGSKVGSGIDQKVGKNVFDLI